MSRASMNRARVIDLALTVWILGAVAIYLRQFAAPALALLSRAAGRH